MDINGCIVVKIRFLPFVLSVGPPSASEKTRLSQRSLTKIGPLQGLRREPSDIRSCRKLKSDTIDSQLKLSENRRIIKKVLEISNLKIIVIDDKIVEHLKIDGNTILEQSLMDDGIIMKIKTENSES